jgi:hypothetical protein
MLGRGSVAMAAPQKLQGLQDVKSNVNGQELDEFAAERLGMGHGCLCSCFPH